MLKVREIKALARQTLIGRYGTLILAGIVAAVFYVLGPLLSFIPFFTGLFGILYAVVIVADAIFIYCAVLVFSNPHKSEKLAKVAMFVALISFILGVAL